MFVNINSPGPICQGAKHTVLYRKVVVSVPIEVLVSMGGFPIQRD